MLFVLGASGGLGSGLVSEAELDSLGVIELSRRDPGSVRKALNESPGTDPVWVIDAAGLSIDGRIDAISEESVLEMVDANVVGPVMVARAFASVSATRPGSSLLYLGSVVSRTGVEGAVTYGATKSALPGLIRGLAREVACYKARVNMIELGYFDRGMMSRLPEKVQSGIVQSIPLRRTGTVKEIWSLALEMLSNPYMTGAVVPLTGGL